MRTMKEPKILFLSCWILFVSCQNSSVQPDALVKLAGVEEAEVAQVLLDSKATQVLDVVEGTTAVTKQTLIDKRLYTLSSQCTSVQSSLLGQCTAPFQSVVDDALSAFTSGLSRIRENIRGIYERTCDRLAVFRSCAADLPKNNDCQLRSCLLDSVIKGCSHRKEQDRHWKCLFRVITNQTVVACYLPAITTPRQGRKLDDPDLWRDVVPQIMTCSQSYLERECGVETLDFLRSLTVPITGARNTSLCPLTLLENLAIPDALDYRSGTIDPSVLSPDSTVPPLQPSLPVVAAVQSNPTANKSSTNRIAANNSTSKSRLATVIVTSTISTPANLSPKQSSKVPPPEKVPTRHPSSSTLSPSPVAISKTTSKGASSTLSNAQKGAVIFPQIVTQPVTPPTGGSSSCLRTSVLHIVWVTSLLLHCTLWSLSGLSCSSAGLLLL